MTIDLFTDARLKPQWEWHYQPHADRWSLTERPGFLRLKAFAPRVANHLAKAGNALTQRVLRTVGGATVTVRLELTGLRFCSSSVHHSPHRTSNQDRPPNLLSQVSGRFS
ncbi:beta-xylosidase family glycoside hydrolase [Kibdelosporangium aridum]|uniref:beta-xylosidase family glycoside hydrolase n=1 Tax=Kibdelosporangium aridum TaxID=2030 RepID=UPI00190EA1E4|nr:hypothetical protein [Kibdelosporangium aridum]